MMTRPWDDLIMDGADLNAALPFRVYGLEGQVKTLDDAMVRQRENTARNTEAISIQGATLARHDEQLKGHQEGLTEVKTDVAALAVSVMNLAEKVATSTTRIAWTFSVFTLTVAGSAIALVLGS